MKSHSKDIHYTISNRKDLKALERKAKFKYIDKYTGPQSKQFRAFFKKSAFKKFLNKYHYPPLVVAKIAILGKRSLGVLATENIRLNKGNKPKGLGIYWGELSYEFTHSSHYVFLVSKYEIDAKKYGNWTRFVNHSKGNHNVIAIQKYKYIGKKGLPYIEYALIKNVRAGEQLLVDYGPQYEFDQKHQIFLNPSNQFLSAKALYQLQAKHYTQLTGRILSIYRELSPTVKKVLAPIQLLYLLKKRKLEGSHQESVPPELPLLHATTAGNILVDKYQPGVSTLMLAAYMGERQAVKLLTKQYHANVNQQHVYQGYNALMYVLQSKAKSSSKICIIKDLVQSGTNLMTQDKDGFTILHWGVKQKNIPALKAIFSNKKYRHEAFTALDVLDRNDFCPITYAISLGDIRTVKYLLGVFEKYYKESFFHPRHNEWFLPLICKIIKYYQHKNLSEMLSVLVAHGLIKNRKVFLKLLPLLKHRGIQLNKL